MSDATEKKFEWATRSLVVGLLGLLVTIAGMYLQTNQAVLKGLRTDLATMREKQHQLELGITERKANAFTAQDGLKAWEAIRDVQSQVADIRAETAEHAADIKAMLMRLDQHRGDP